MKLLKIHLVVILGFVCILSCKKPNSYPDEPVITFKSITIEQDTNGHDVSAHLVISFTDGDGDLGYSSSDNNTPINFIVKQDTMSMGNWGSKNNDSLFSGRIPYLTPEGNNKALKGDISTNISFLFGHPVDTLRYEVRIIDRALHESNTIITPQIVVHTE